MACGCLVQGVLTATVHLCSLSLRYGNITLSSKDFAATRVFWGKLNFKMIYIMGDQWMEMLGPGNVRLGFSPPYGGKCESEANHFIGVGCTDVGK